MHKKQIDFDRPIIRNYHQESFIHDSYGDIRDGWIDVGSFLCERVVTQKKCEQVSQKKRSNKQELVYAKFIKYTCPHDNNDDASKNHQKNCEWLMNLNRFRLELKMKVYFHSL